MPLENNGGAASIQREVLPERHSLSAHWAAQPRELLRVFRMKNNYFDIIGWAGAAVSFSAYTMNTQQLLSSTSMIFLAMNIFACSCMIVYTFRKRAFANTAINSAFLLVTLFAIGGGLLGQIK